MAGNRKRNTGTNRIKEEINIQGRKTSWIYDQIGVKRSTFYQWTNNFVQPSIFDLKKIAQLLDVTMEDLVN